MKIVTKLKNEITNFESFKKISFGMLRSLGYEPTMCYIPLGEKPYNFKIYEMKNLDNKREISFCFLYSTREKVGIVLPNTFGTYAACEGCDPVLPLKR